MVSFSSSLEDFYVLGVMSIEFGSLEVGCP